MENKANNNAYNMELMALIKSGIKPEEAKKIADSHFGNYAELTQQITKQRNKEKEIKAKQMKYARILSARIKSGEKPNEVVEDMDTLEL